MSCFLQFVIIAILYITYEQTAINIVDLHLKGGINLPIEKNNITGSCPAPG
jgi:hypothetical protein